jgi:hypothetical protein
MFASGPLLADFKPVSMASIKIVKRLVSGARLIGGSRKAYGARGYSRAADLTVG